MPTHSAPSGATANADTAPNEDVCGSGTRRNAPRRHWTMAVAEPNHTEPSAAACTRLTVPTRRAGGKRTVARVSWSMRYTTSAPAATQTVPVASTAIPLPAYVAGVPGTRRIVPSRWTRRTRSLRVMPQNLPAESIAAALIWSVVNAESRAAGRTRPCSYRNSPASDPIQSAPSGSAASGYVSRWASPRSAGAVDASTTVNRAPSNRASPDCDESQRYPSRVWARLEVNVNRAPSCRRQTSRW